ncbi:hypothetical protein ACFLXV_02180 [Chloroflexota bacterium]
MMRETYLAAPQETEVKGECQHHWVIESPNGPTSTGSCKHCGAVKEFDNFTPFSSWDDERAKYGKKSGRSDMKSDESSYDS